ncbi:hypothetical protein BDN67DRAFT_985455 [Paxillus ammoniavirescens]|nr:hypothetical protein BDN67DRAFT_985455 [Paxillus ammoniavirescens]
MIKRPRPSTAQNHDWELTTDGVNGFLGRKRKAADAPLDEPSSKRSNLQTLALLPILELASNTTTFPQALKRKREDYAAETIPFKFASTMFSFPTHASGNVVIPALGTITDIQLLFYLPNELLHAIVSLLGADDLQTCTKVSTLLRDIAGPAYLAALNFSPTKTPYWLSASGSLEITYSLCSSVPISHVATCEPSRLILNALSNLPEQWYHAWYPLVKLPGLCHIGGPPAYASALGRHLQNPGTVTSLSIFMINILFPHNQLSSVLDCTDVFPGLYNILITFHHSQPIPTSSLLFPGSEARICCAQHLRMACRFSVVTDDNDGILHLGHQTVEQLTDHNTANFSRSDFTVAM